MTGSFHHRSRPFAAWQQALTEGETIPITLTLEKAGPVSTSVIVEKAGAPRMQIDSMRR
jgi:copper(I)-binding protein